MAREDLTVPGRLKLVVRGTDKVAEISAARPEISVGRARDNDIVVLDSSVSRRQVRFVYRDGAVFAVDLHSSCGTYVDGRLISGPSRLRRGAVVSFADHDIDLIEG